MPTSQQHRSLLSMLDSLNTHHCDPNRTRWIATFPTDTPGRDCLLDPRAAGADRCAPTVRTDLILCCDCALAVLWLCCGCAVAVADPRPPGCTTDHFLHFPRRCAASYDMCASIKRSARAYWGLIGV